MNILSCRSGVQRTAALLKENKKISAKLNALENIENTSNSSQALKKNYLLNKKNKNIDGLKREEKNSNKIMSEMKSQWEELISRNKIDRNGLDRLEKLVNLNGGNAIILAKNEHEMKAISYIIRYNKHQQNLDDIKNATQKPVPLSRTILRVTQDDIQAGRKRLKQVSSAASQPPVEKKEPPVLLPRTVFGSFVPLTPAGRRRLQSVSPMLISQYPTKPPKPANLELKYLQNGEIYSLPRRKRIIILN